MTTLIRKDRLKNGLVLEFHDRSNRYFGDYHRVLIEVRCRIPVIPSAFSASEDPVRELEQARSCLGEEVAFTHRLEKMGVAGGELERTRRDLIEGYLRSAASYLESARFPARVIGAELERRRRGGRHLCLVRR